MQQADIITIINQIFEIERKTPGKRIQRNLQRIKTVIEKASYKWHNPAGEKYDLTRSDCEASIAGESAENLLITEVIKPIIYFSENNRNYIVQKAIVVAENDKR